MKTTEHRKRNGLALWLLTLMCLASVNVWGQETVYLEEDFSSITAGNNNTTNGSSESWDGNDNFSKLVNIYEAGGAVKLGKSKDAGALTTKTLDLSANNGIFYVTFDVKGWTTIEGDIKISLDGTEKETVEYSATINDAFETKTVEISGGTSNSTITIATTSKRAFIDNVKIFTKASSTTQCSAPTFSPASGTSFANTLTVTASTATEGGKIVYTTDPEATLDANSTEFPSEGLTIDATTTIRAITVDPNGALENSGEASATYTKIDALNGLAELRAKIREDNVTSQKNAKEYIVSLNNAVVTKVSGNKAFIEENGTGIQYFNKSNSFKESQVINGTATVKGFMYSNWAELTSIEGDITITDGGAVAPTEVTLEELTNNYDKYESRLVKVTAAEVTSAFNSQNGEISQNGFKFAVRANDESISMTLGETIDIIGVPGIYVNTKQLNVYSQDDINEVGKTAATLEFEQSSYTVNFDEIITLKAVSNNPDAQITYSATEGDWVIDETSGEFFAGTTAGSVTVTATLAESDKYTGATATCTVNIVDPNQQVYSDVITAEDLTAPDTHYTDFSGVTKTSGAVYAGNSAKNNSGSIQLRSSEKSGIVTTTSGGRISQIIITWDSQTTSGRQLDIYGSDEPYTSAADLYVNKKPIASAKYEDESTTSTLTIEGNYPYVGIRSKSNALYIKDITFVWEKVSEPTTGSFSITDAGFATYYTDKAFVMPENVQGGIVTKANNETSQLTVSYNYQPGTVVPAKTPIVLKGEKGDYTVNYTTSEETAPAGNMLYGADNVDADGMTFVEGTNVKYYKLALGNDGKCGFYWGATDGAAFEYTANRAFLAIDITDASQAPEGFSLDGDGGTTDIDGVMNGNDDSQKIYTVTGVYAGKSLDKLPKGIYIVGGKKVAVK